MRRRVVVLDSLRDLDAINPDLGPGPLKNGRVWQDTIPEKYMYAAALDALRVRSCTIIGPLVQIETHAVSFNHLVKSRRLIAAP